MPELYTDGFATYANLLGYTQTRRDLARARYAVLTGALRLRQASGTLQEEDLQPINALLEPQQKEEPEEPAAPGQP